MLKQIFTQERVDALQFFGTAFVLAIAFTSAFLVVTLSIMGLL